MKIHLRFALTCAVELIAAIDLAARHVTEQILDPKAAKIQAALPARTIVAK